MHNNQKKIAVINDYSGFGRCSLAVEIPIISALKVQCCALPTSVFSNHTGFKSFYMEDFTDSMIPYMNEWEKLGLKFSGISTGFLGSARQIDIVRNFIEKFKTEDTIVIVDPVMGDYGHIYPTYTEDMCRRMKELIRYADILTPNLTEACMLTATPYKERFKMAEVAEIANALLDAGPSKVVITGISQKSFICNLCCEKGTPPVMIKSHKVGCERSGTGDVFTSIISADAVNGVEFSASVRKASRFIKKCIERSIEMNIPVTDGVAFEELLTTLK